MNQIFTKSHELDHLPEEYLVFDCEFLTNQKNKRVRPLQISLLHIDKGRKVGKQLNQFVFYKDMIPQDLLRGLKLSNKTYSSYINMTIDESFRNVQFYLSDKFHLPIIAWGSTDFQILELVFENQLYDRTIYQFLKLNPMLCCDLSLFISKKMKMQSTLKLENLTNLFNLKNPTHNSLDDCYSLYHLYETIKILENSKR